jgi:tetratricopeptide (TPR) repeat protein
MRAARRLWREMPDAYIRQNGWFIEGIVPTKYHVMIRFGRWSEILAEPAPPDHYIVSVAVHHYARSIAHSALGHIEPARAELEAFEHAAARIPGHWLQFNNRIEDILPVARAMARGELLFREGRLDEAFAVLREGAAAEDALVYDEPPAWMVPVRHALGALLMAAGRYAEAERAYREDLQRNLDNGWGLLGLEQALAAQGRGGEIDGLTARRATAWARADVMATSSCFCEPGRRTYR